MERRVWQCKVLCVRVCRMIYMCGSRNFCQGVQVRLPALTFFNPQLILQFYRGCPMVISKKTIIFPDLRVGPTFSKGGPTFSRGGGPNANFYRNI